MTKQQPSFTQNINYLARNIHLLERGRELFTPSAVQALETAIKLPLEDIVLDVKKGVTEYGRRKLDIQPNLNSKRDSSWVTYSGITIFGASHDEGYRINFAPIFRPEDIAHQINLAVENFNTQVSDPERTITNLKSELVILDKPDAGHQWLLRYTDTAVADTDTRNTNLGAIVLHVTSETSQYAHEVDVEYSWFKTTSSILQLSSSVATTMRAMGITLRAAAEAEASANLAEEYRDDTQNTSDAVNAAMEEFLRSIEYNVAGEYAAGLVLTSPNDIVRMSNGVYWSIISGTELPLTLTGNIVTDGQFLREIPFASMKSLQNEVAARQAADDNLQAQFSGAEPLEASAFSPISWHDQSIENSVTIPPNKNAWSFGPTMTIAAGQAVTVSEGSSWTIANGEVQ